MMLKHALALAAITAATGAALAQPIVYGRLDLGMMFEESTRGVAPTGTEREVFSLAGAEGEASSSRLGFRGSEDLGAGLRAGFVYEIGINADRNTAAATSPADNARTRLANLSLSGGFGTVTIGTFMNALDLAREGLPSFEHITGGRTNSFDLDPLAFERVDGRSQNAIMYESPAVAGLTFRVSYELEDISTRPLAGGPATGQEREAWIMGLDFRQGPLRVGLAHGSVTVTSAAGGPSLHDLSTWVLSASYDHGPAVLSLVYEDMRNVRLTRNRAAHSWQVGVRFPMGSFAPFASYGQGEIQSLVAGRTLIEDVNTWQFGITYHFSRRTWAYAAIGRGERDTAAGTTVRLDNGYSMGVVHTF